MFDLCVLDVFVCCVITNKLQAVHYLRFAIVSFFLFKRGSCMGSTVHFQSKFKKMYYNLMAIKKEESLKCIHKQAKP